jgi:tetratricopeptide (TPR) repeat protein
MKKLLGLTLLALVSTATVASADAPGKHPAYLHALSDLRNARWNLQHRKGDAEVKWDEKKAIQDIDAAIKKVKEAAQDDGKNIDDHMAVDAKLDYSGRLHHALEDLRAAHNDIDKEEDNDFAKGLKHRALVDIDAALHRTKEALCNAGDKNLCGG